MNIELQKPELERRLRGGIESGRFENVDEFLTKALTLDWAQCPAVESVPGKVSRAWLFGNTRRPVAAVFETSRMASPSMNW